MSRGSALAETPVEIWTEIIRQVLDDPVFFRTDPFYLGCNLHSVLPEWYNLTAKSYRNRRDTLRLVSRAWKELIDSRFDWVLEYITDVTAVPPSRWRSARRIHINVGPPDIYGPGSKAKIRCQATRHTVTDSMDTRQIHDHELLLHKLAEGRPLPAEIVVLESSVWSIICGTLHQDKLTWLFSNVHILEIASNPPPPYHTFKIPDFLPKLTCLSILGFHILEKGRARFPHLTTLRFRHLHDDLETGQNWDLPQLRHLEIEFQSPFIFYRSGLAFLRKGRLLLLSLTITILTQNNVALPQDIWTSLPNLQYLACHPPPSLLGNGFDIQPDYPLRTLGFLSPVDHIIKREKLMSFIDHMPNLAIVADFHDWEYFTFPPFTPVDLLRHTCEEGYCNACTVEIHAFCTSRNLRYEDRWGRSLEEFKSTHPV